MAHHNLRTWPRYFNEVVSGKKTFEMRSNDRDFREGDTVTLQEYDPVLEAHTGRELSFRIGYVLNSVQKLGLPKLSDEIAVVFSLLPVDEGQITEESARQFLAQYDKIDARIEEIFRRTIEPTLGNGYYLSSWLPAGTHIEIRWRNTRTDELGTRLLPISFLWSDDGILAIEKAREAEAERKAELDRQKAARVAALAAAAEERSAEWAEFRSWKEARARGETWPQ